MIKHCHHREYISHVLVKFLKIDSFSVGGLPGQGSSAHAQSSIATMEKSWIAHVQNHFELQRAIRTNLLYGVDSRNRCHY
ncbi:unnamed protein product [Nesidiocoris tenuis]|uniref:Uncharacterized protein n=1 Tax=Nesidiocoris tenuis TaxID=355587 RepID=A0A6H5GE20_9HEMI|nr:unnamed protein product [Nesidiocoris tenuis]